LKARYPKADLVHKGCAVGRTRRPSEARASKHLLRITGTLDFDGGGHGSDLIEIVRCERHGERSQILIETVELPRAKQGDDPWLLGEQPGEGDLRWGRLMPIPDCA
jgi:hypothetical protein